MQLPGWMTQKLNIKMEIEFDPEFRTKYDKVNVRIKNQTKDKLRIFKKNPEDPQLNNHPLKREWYGYRSIDITNDYRAIYEEKIVGSQTIAYFVVIGTHEKLYSPK